MTSWAEWSQYWDHDNRIKGGCVGVHSLYHIVTTLFCAFLLSDMSTKEQQALTAGRTEVTHTHTHTQLLPLYWSQLRDSHARLPDRPKPVLLPWLLVLLARLGLMTMDGREAMRPTVFSKAFFLNPCLKSNQIISYHITTDHSERKWLEVGSGLENTGASQSRIWGHFASRYK